ncbi:MAG TPA: hypothetical protein PLN21_07880 [Gemmatales bacterium]|nr:hypothetical protein [Gemmatales bacterium]
MNNDRLPLYPEHPEPDQRNEGAEFEKESKPRTMPGMVVWMALALMIGLYFAQRFIAQYVGKEPLPIQAPAKSGKSGGN